MARGCAEGRPISDHGRSYADRPDQAQQSFVQSHDAPIPPCAAWPNPGAAICTSPSTARAQYRGIGGYGTNPFPVMDILHRGSSFCWRRSWSASIERLSPGSRGQRRERMLFRWRAHRPLCALLEYSCPLRTCVIGRAGPAMRVGRRGSLPTCRPRGGTPSISYSAGPGQNWFGWSALSAGPRWRILRVMRLTRLAAAMVAFIGLPCCVCSCASTCADEKCGGPASASLVSGNLVSVSRIDGRVISKATSGEVFMYAGAVPNQGRPRKFRTSSAGAFKLLLGAGTYFFTGKADATGASCTTVQPLVLPASDAEPTVTIKCPAG